MHIREAGEERAGDDVEHIRLHEGLDGVVLGLGGVAGHAFSGVPRGHPGYFNRAWLQQNCSAVTGACMVVRKVVFEQAGGLDEVNLAISFNDIDFCLRLRAAGFQNVSREFEFEFVYVWLNGGSRVGTGN